LEKGPDFAAEALLRIVLGVAAWEGLPEPLKGRFRQNSPAVAAEIAGGLPPLAADDLGRVQVPVLVVGAEESPPAFRAIVEGLVDELPNAQALLVEGGHLISPDDVDVLRFLDGVLTGTQDSR
jgi:pimeloyl-ACP methyl ester carboxylesterase